MIGPVKEIQIDRPRRSGTEGKAIKHAIETKRGGGGGVEVTD